MKHVSIGPEEGLLVEVGDGHYSLRKEARDKFLGLRDEAGEPLDMMERLVC